MFGFVELAVDLTTGENVAIKYLERGKKVLLILNNILYPSASCCESGEPEKFTVQLTASKCTAISNLV